jgi:hypothetical protein
MRLAGAYSGNPRASIRLAKIAAIAYRGAMIRSPEGVLAMRLWIAMTIAAVGLAAGTWWLTRSPEKPITAVSLATPETRTVASLTPRTLPPSPPMRRRTNAVEPIAVIPETDAVVEPGTVPALPTNLVREVSDRLVPRPESGTEPMPWMPYADEDGELVRNRREARDRLARAQTAEPPLLGPIRELQETAEPPLNMPGRPATTWRPQGKLPCSVK